MKDSLVVLIAILSILGCGSNDNYGGPPPKVETVMTEGMEIIAVTSEGTITIKAGKGFDRTYIWSGCERTVTLLPRYERWKGSLGIYYPGMGHHWKECDGINRAVVQEGIQHFDAVEKAYEWIRSETYLSYTYSNDGLLVAWRRSKEREELSAEVWQVLVSEHKPHLLKGANDSSIRISYSGNRTPSLSANSHELELLSAAENSDEAKVRSLLARGVNPNVQAKDDRHTPLMAAAAIGDVKIIEILLGAGADVNMLDCCATALIYAVMNDHTSAVQALVSHKANVNSRDSSQRTALMYASMSGQLDIVHLLLERKDVDLDLQDAEGATALMYAASMGHIEIARALIESGANPALTDKNGRAATAYAESAGYPDIVRLIQQSANRP